MTRDGESGYALAALIAAVTLMLIGLGAAAPTWKYVMKNDREEELIFRGGQIADAIARYQKKNANALPPSLEVLVKGKYLRKAWKDPVAKDGKWRFVRQGESLTPAPRKPGAPSPAPTTTLPPSPGSSSGGPIGGFVGVASMSPDASLRLFNGRNRYNEWIFAAGQPRVVGKQPQLPGPKPGFPGAPGSPGGPGTPGGPPPGLPLPDIPDSP